MGRVGRLLLVPLLALAALCYAVPAEAAVEVLPAPADASFTLLGYGYGHGRGLSQWGANGAAVSGLSWTSILDFYYPGTTRTPQPDTVIRVWLERDTDNDARVLARSGMTATADGYSTVALPVVSAQGGPIVLWRVRRDASGLRLAGLDGTTGAWLSHDITGLGYSPGGITLTDPTGSTRLGYVETNTFVDYRGSIKIIPWGSAPGQRTLALSPMESYLRSVVPSEMPSAWPADALRAQSVAARSYASRERADRAGQAYDTCDSTSCQVYRGRAQFAGDASTLTQTFEAASSDAAVAATGGVVLTYGGTIAFTQFSASNGGWTTDGGQPYLPAKPDPYDGVVSSSAHSWRVPLTVTAIQSAYPGVGAMQRLRVLGRDGHGIWGGRIGDVSVEGTSGSVVVSAAAFRASLGLKSTWWTVSDSTRRNGDVDGDGLTDVLGREQVTGVLWDYRGDGAGGIQGRQSLGYGWETMDLLVWAGDWTGDGVGDVIARERDTGRLYLYVADGGGGWTEKRLINSGWRVMDAILGAGDMDGDGAPDLVARETATGTLWLYRGDGQGGFRGTRTSMGWGWETLDLLLAPGDWNGDGYSDVLGRDRATGVLWAYTGNGRGGWLSKTWTGYGWETMSLLVGRGDVDGDGRVDIIARDYGGVLWLYPSDGKGWMLPRQSVGSGWTIMDALP
jgi:SpoIID/LytB domain protein